MLLSGCVSSSADNARAVAAANASSLTTSVKRAVARAQASATAANGELSSRTHCQLIDMHSGTQQQLHHAWKRPHGVLGHKLHPSVAFTGYH